MKSDHEITEKARRFAHEYVYNDGSKTKEECALSAGYSKSSAKSRASDLTNPRKHPAVVKYIQDLQAEVNAKFDVSYGRHIRKLAEIRDCALDKGNYTSAVAAEVQRGRAAGLYVDRKEIRTGTLEALSEDQLIKKVDTLIADVLPLLDRPKDPPKTITQTAKVVNED